MAKVLSNCFVSRVVLAVLLSTLIAVTPLRAHEVQPGVMDIEIQSDTMDVFIEWILEAPIAGIDLENLEDTNASEQEDEYLRLRALDPQEMDSAFREAWPGLSQKLTFRAGETNLAPELIDVSVPEVGNIEISRTSTIQLSVPLPAGSDPITIGWTMDLGELIVRQRTIEDGYAALLTPGQLTDPIPRSTACESWYCSFTRLFGG